MNAGTWLKLVRNSTIAATLVTAAQVGIGSGVGIIDWQPGLAGPDGWRNLLTWVVFMSEPAAPGNDVPVLEFGKRLVMVVREAFAAVERP